MQPVLRTSPTRLRLNSICDEVQGDPGSIYFFLEEGKQVSVGITCHEPPIREWFIPTIYGGAGDGLLMLYPH